MFVNYYGLSGVMMDSTVKSILEQDETVLWQGKQDFTPTIIQAIVIFGLIIAFGALPSFLMENLKGGTCRINGQIRPVEDCIKLFQNISYIMFVLGALIPVITYFRYRVTKYVISNKRVILKTGLIGADIRSVYYDKIRTAYVNVGPIGNFFGTGSIKIDTGRMTRANRNRKIHYDKISNIKKPYGVYKILQETISNYKETLHAEGANIKSDKMNSEIVVDKETLLKIIGIKQKVFRVIAGVIFLLVILRFAKLI